jgi:hypothetical protein
MSARSDVECTVGLDGPDLLVDGAPFLVIGGELHNSSSSSERAISTAFDKVQRLGANTVLAPVAWDLWEPEEGVFDTRLVDAMLTAARERGLRLVLLWFGSWKNAMSSYVPAWVKRDPARFPRAHTRSSGRIEHLTPFATTSRDADAAAFRRLMLHLHDVDRQRTVIMVQVENELGLLGDSRDRCPLAEEAYRSLIPNTVVDAIEAAPHLPVHQDWLDRGSRREGTWEELLGGGPNADEAFMAHAFATYLEHVAATGRAVHDVPLYANAWLDVPMRYTPEEDAAQDGEHPTVPLAGGEQPGAYPSGGPVIRVAPLWRAAAPTLDFLAPDIYFGDPDATCKDYKAASGRLFIPEMRRSPLGIGLMFTALGELDAIGVAPFGVDSFADDDPEDPALADAYRLLGVTAEQVRAGARRVAGFLLNHRRPSAQVSVGPYTLTFSAPGITKDAGPSYGLALQEGPDVFLLVGRGFTTTFATEGDVKVGILSAEELDASGRVLRHLNGDETGSGSMAILNRFQASQPGGWPIPFSTAATGLVRVQLYTY